MTGIDSLISPSDLLQDRSRWRVIDARAGVGSRESFEDEHLEGAVFAALERDLASVSSDPTHGGRHPLPSIEQWCSVLDGWGLLPETPVAIYDDHGGALAAARVWWMLRAVGHVEVALIDGGWSALTESDAPFVGGRVPPPQPTAYPRPSDWLLPVIDITAAARWRHAPDLHLVDVRSEERFRGDTDPYDPVPGHIPGAVSAPYGRLLDANGRLRREQLETFVATAVGPHSPSDVAFYCGSGVTACYGIFACHLGALSGRGALSGLVERVVSPRSPAGSSPHLGLNLPAGAASGRSVPGKRKRPVPKGAGRSLDSQGEWATSCRPFHPFRPCHPCRRRHRAEPGCLP